MLVKRPYKSLHCLLTHEKEAHFHPVVCDEEQKNGAQPHVERITTGKTKPAVPAEVLAPVAIIATCRDHLMLCWREICATTSVAVLLYRVKDASFN